MRNGPDENARMADAADEVGFLKKRLGMERELAERVERREAREQGSPRRGDTGARKPEFVQITPTPFTWRDPATMPRRQWVYGRHLVRKFLSCTVAPGGVGKTSLLLVEAVAMATGRPLLGKTVHGGPKRVWCINLEDPREEIERRVLAILMHYGIDPCELGDRLFLDSGREIKVIIATTTKNGTVVAQPVVEALKLAISDRRLDVLIVDPLVKAHAVSENDNGAIDAVCSAFAEIADETDIAVDLVHHVRKSSGASEFTVDDGRGASALLGAVRSARVLNTMSKDEAEKAGVLVSREYFRDTNGKANLAPPIDKADWYRLRSVSLGNGSGASGLVDDSDHVQVVEQWTWPDHTRSVTLDHLRAVQDAVDAGHYRADLQAKAWVGHVVATVMNLNLDKPTDKQTVKASLAMWFASGALRKVEGLTEKREMKDFVEVGERAI